MTSATLLLVAGGALAVMIGLLVVLIVARSLDGSSGAGAAKLSEQIEKATTTLQAAGRSASKWSPGPLGITLAALTSQSGENNKATDDERKGIKQFITGLAVAGGLIALIVGIITGDG